MSTSTSDDRRALDAAHMLDTHLASLIAHAQLARRAVVAGQTDQPIAGWLTTVLEDAAAIVAARRVRQEQS